MGNSKETEKCLKEELKHFLRLSVDLLLLDCDFDGKYSLLYFNSFHRVPLNKHGSNAAPIAKNAMSSELWPAIKINNIN